MSSKIEAMRRMGELLLAGLVSACSMAAQPAPGTGSLAGYVLHSFTSAPVRKATVILTAPQIRLVAETGADGQFEFTGLPPGTYLPCRRVMRDSSVAARAAPWCWAGTGT